MTGTPDRLAASHGDGSPGESAPHCTLCGGRSRRAFQRHGIWILDCLACGHRFAIPPALETHIETTYGDDYFSGGGAGYPDYLAESALLVAQGRRYGRLLRRYTPAGRLLDVGAAAGFLLSGLRDEGWDGWGVEPNGRMARHARERLRLSVVEDAFENLAPGTPLDVVTLIQVVAHLVDPAKSVEKLHELLRPGGACLVETWNWRSWPARLFGQSWHEYSPPSVLHWFTPDSLERLFSLKGFERVGIGRPQKWLQIGHARSLLTRIGQDSLAARVAAKAIGMVPAHLTVPYPSADLFWSVFRKI
jgi:SAM-dependent methyltransferase